MSSRKHRIAQYALTPEIRNVRDSIFEFLSNRRVMILITVVPASVLFILLNLLPTTWTFFASLYNIPLYSTEWEWVGLANYGSIISDGAFWRSLWLSLVFTVGSVSLQLFLGVGIALLLNRTYKFMTIGRTVMLIPYLVPSAFVASLGLWMNNSTFGITNRVLAELGLINEFLNFYGSTELAMISVIFTFSWKFTFFVTILVLAQLNSISDTLYEAAEVNGASTWDKFRDITLPNLKGVLFIIILLRGVWTFNKFDIIWVLTRGGPGEATRTLPVYGYEAAFTTGDLGKATAISAVMYLIIVVSAVVYFYVLEPEQEVRVE